MKNFSLLLLLLTGIAFTSCKKNPDEKAADNIIGKWYLQSSNEKEYKNGKLIEEQNTSKPSETMAVEFKSDGTGVDNHGYKFSYKITGSKLTFKYEDSDEEETQEIRKLTSSELVVYGEENWEENTDQYRYVFESTYKKK